MITCTLSILVKRERQAVAVETLAAIERAARTDPGCRAFSWLQDENDPQHFLLFEQWETEADLQAHLARDPGIWNDFTPALTSEPQATRYRRVADLLPLGEAEIRDFVTAWFDRLSAHVPVEQLLPMVTASGLTMTFPEATLTNQGEFRNWYDVVGSAFTDQTHLVEELHIRPSGTGADLAVVVIWRTRQTSDGATLAFRAHQSWRLERSPITGTPVIVAYRVLSMDELAAAS